MEIKNFKSFHGKALLESLIAQGEHEQQDFKFAINDSRKIARSIAAFANNSGGRLLVGVKDNGNIAGIRSDEEYYMIEQAAEMYCRPPQKVEQKVYCSEGKYVLLIEIKKADKRPVKAQDDEGNYRIYYRVADENIVAPNIFERIWKSKHKKGVLLSFSDDEAALLSLIANEPMTISELVKMLHLSKQKISDTIVFLCSMQLMSPIYIGGKWRFKATIPEE